MIKYAFWLKLLIFQFLLVIVFFINLFVIIVVHGASVKVLACDAILVNITKVGIMAYCMAYCICWLEIQSSPVNSLLSSGPGL